MFEKLDQMIEDMNFRPLMMSMRQLASIFHESSFHAIRFYVTQTKTSGVRNPVLTLRYVLMNNQNKPYSLDGKPVRILNLNKFRNSLIGLDVINTGFELPKIASPATGNFGLDSIIGNYSTPSVIPGNDEFVAFILTDKDISDTGVNFKLTYGRISWGSGGIGGPGTGIRVIP